MDEPEGIRHLVDNPRAQRCDQHREQRDRWNDANSFRRNAGKSLLEWVPDPLTPERRREALMRFRDVDARDIRRTVSVIRDVLPHLEALKQRLPASEQENYVAYVRRITASCADLETTARVMEGRRSREEPSE